VVALIDLDGFADLNDRVGRAEGDEVLRSFAAMLVRAARPGDIACRLGDDGFAVVSTEMDIPGSLAVLDEIRRVWQASAPHPVTFSVGLAAVADGGATAALLAAERALGRAKALGRDRTEMATTTGQDPRFDLDR
jgi:diguanylate cyclase (GGDEF)-like protein